MRNFPWLLRLSWLGQRAAVAAILAVLSGVPLCVAQTKPAAAKPAPDVLVLSNGDTLHGRFVNETGGKVTFHCDPLGDLTVGWDKIEELHVIGQFGVVSQSAAAHGKKHTVSFPVGRFDVTNHAVVVHPARGPAATPIPVAQAEYIAASDVLDKQINRRPGLFASWNGTATAGATFVSATQNQYTFNGAVNLVRAVPAVSWLAARNRTLFGFNDSYGRITQPAYSYSATPPATGVVAVPAVVTQSSILHVGAERDAYIAPRFYVLAQTAFDHNFAQQLQLQQIYGGGFGWTAVKTPQQELDFNGTVQYEKQQFMAGAATTNQNLVGSTFAASYALRLKLFTVTQSLSFIPAYNQLRAYSATETDTVSFPAYKRFSFTLGTLDTYLNDAPFVSSVATPPTKPNSFQFTMGLTYAIKSKD